MSGRNILDDSVISFTGWKKNPAFANGTFRFVPEKNVDVIGQR